IKREVTGEGGQYQINGHGPHYGYYHSPMLSLVSGMLLGSMISSAFRPNYAPAAYTTSSSRAGALRSYRNDYRAKNPSRFSKQNTSRSGRNYGSGNRSSSSPSRRSSGGGFGLHRQGRKRREKPVRLSA
ncbi:MAG: hypothetical protein AAGC55_34700, partial [Myxococcota bacterium]